MMGDQQGGIDALNTARQLWQRSSKDADLSDALDAAGLRAGRTGSGGNINNATRQTVSQVLTGRSDWTPDENAALRSLVMGTPTGNVLRQVGKLSPEGNGLMQGLNILGGGEALNTGHPISFGDSGYRVRREAFGRSGNHSGNRKPRRSDPRRRHQGRAPGTAERVAAVFGRRGRSDHARDRRAQANRQPAQ